MMAYVYAGVAAIILATSGFGWIQTKRLEALHTEYENFKVKIAALGEAAQKESDQKYFEAIKDKEEANAENAKAISNLNDSIAKLRAQRTGSNLVSSATPAAKRPDLACYDRLELTGALRSYEGEIEVFLAEGGAATVDLNTAKDWAKSLR